MKNNASVPWPARLTGYICSFSNIFKWIACNNIINRMQCKIYLIGKMEETNFVFRTVQKMYVVCEGGARI